MRGRVYRFQVSEMRSSAKRAVLPRTYEYASEFKTGHGSNGQAATTFLASRRS